ncbi:hypothetical protein NMY22_g4712 [Coprinellus aureogranulatus]|nr:hypothetical protein NMY22_g4712 [Coprinellus aureogranulatus]
MPTFGSLTTGNGVSYLYPIRIEGSDSGNVPVMGSIPKSAPKHPAPGYIWGVVVRQGWLRDKIKKLATDGGKLSAETFFSQRIKELELRLVFLYPASSDARLLRVTTLRFAMEPRVMRRNSLTTLILFVGNGDKREMLDYSSSQEKSNNLDLDNLCSLLEADADEREALTQNMAWHRRKAEILEETGSAGSIAKVFPDKHERFLAGGL